MADSAHDSATRPEIPARAESTEAENFYAAHCNLKELAKIADGVVIGTFASPLHGKGDDPKVIAEDWLRWGQSDEPKVRMQWAHLSSKEKKCRDVYVLTLWKSITRPGGANNSLRSYIEEEHAPWSYYERHFFGWFLGRFNLGAARQVFSGARLANSLHYIIAGMTVLFTILLLNLQPHLSTSLWFFLPFSLLLVGFCFLAPKLLQMPYYAYAHSLIPRLAATIAIGYLFLASAPQLIRLIYESARSPWQFWTASLLLTAATLVYIVLHIARRVHPVPSLPRLFRRGFDLLVLAIAYSALELWPAAPILFSNSLLYEKGGGPLIAPPSKLVFCAVVALNLGVLLQLAWDEKPLTEPL